MEHPECSIFAGKKCKIEQALWKIFWQFLINVTTAKYLPERNKNMCAHKNI